MNKLTGMYFCPFVDMMAFVLFLTLIYNDCVNGQITDASQTTTTLRPERERTCVPGFVCKHGYCVQAKTLECVCDPGWIGAFCEKQCPLDCGEHGICSVFTGEPSCVCDWLFTGPQCDQIKLLPNTTTTPSPSTTTTIPQTVRDQTTTTIDPILLQTTTKLPQTVTNTTTQSSTSSTSSSNTTSTTSHTTIVPNTTVSSTSGVSTDQVPTTTTTPSNTSSNTSLELTTISSTTTAVQTTTQATTTELSVTSASTVNPRRTECFPGFVCENGHCPEGRLICICAEGFTGPFCEWPCNKSCGSNGRCNRYNDGVIFCDCDPGYSGEKCQHVQTTVSDTTSTTPPTTIAVVQTTTQTHVTTVVTDPKQCQPDFTCINGYCNTTIRGPSCICETGWTGVYCDRKCTLICDKNEICDFLPDGTSYCKCNTGAQCTGYGANSGQITDIEGLDSMWYWYVIGGCAGVLVLLLILLVLIPYCLWKRRALFIMRIMYMFQPYEDDDEKLFDVFISYKSTAKDEDFVLRQLFPRLETDNSFKLCLHFRDFIPGETISNNIKWAVENSRRTILVLTPDYIQSEFSKYEYQRAQYAMFNDKNRIIPIVLEDVSQQMKYLNDTLQSLVKSITCLTWPGEKNEAKLYKFWKRLELSLPKKRQERHLCKKKTKPKNESVKLRRFSKDHRPMSTEDNDFVRLAIEEESILSGISNNGYRYSRDTNSMTALM